MKLSTQLATAATLSVAAFGANAGCTGGNSAACTAQSQTGNAVAQASAEGGQGGNVKVPAVTLGIGAPATSANLGPGGCGVGGWEVNLGVFKKWGVEGDKQCMSEVATAQARRQACLDALELSKAGVTNNSPRAQQLGNMGVTMAIQNCDGAAMAAQQTIDLGILCQKLQAEDGKKRILDLFNRCIIDSTPDEIAAQRTHEMAVAKAGKSDQRIEVTTPPAPPASCPKEEPIQTKGRRAEICVKRSTCGGPCERKEWVTFDR